MSDLTLALLIFGVCYLAIITERWHKTIATLFGAALMISLGVLTQEEAFHSREFGVDYNVIFLLIGMMVIINITRKTGLFEVLAIWAAKRSDARPARMLILLCVITAVLSALLDNVTTVLLMAPVTLEITRRLQLDPVPFLVSEALASNIGGTATLVGDPPNIMIASKAQLGFMDFLFTLAPIVIVIMLAFVSLLWLAFGRKMVVSDGLREAIMALSESDAVKHPAMLRRCLALLAVMTAGFCLHGWLHLEPATVALLGASLFMLVGHPDEDEAGARELDYLMQVEWKTIFFF